MRIIVAGTLRFAGGESACAEIIRGGAAHIEAGRREEGCIAYNWAVDPLDPGLMHVYEEWESEQSLLRHFQGKPYALMGAHLNAYEMTGFDVSLYSVAGVEPVYGEDGVARMEIFGVSLD